MVPVHVSAHPSRASLALSGHPDVSPGCMQENLGLQPLLPQLGTVTKSPREGVVTGGGGSHVISEHWKCFANKSTGRFQIPTHR